MRGSFLAVARALFVVGLVALAPCVRGSEWQDAELCACCCDGCDGCGCGGCCSGCPSSCGGCSDGYWLDIPLADELADRLVPMMKEMAANGFIYGVGATQFYQGVADGGAEQTFDYGGKVDQYFLLDSGKLGLWEGMTVTMHAETRFGEDVNFQAVGLSPVNLAMLYPNTGEHDTAITNLSFAQAVNEEVQLTFGKFNFVDFFQGLYPQTGRGVDGFMNGSMVLPLSVARVAPLSMMGVGALKLKGKQIQGLIVVYDTHSVPTTSGFDELFDNGANIFACWRFFTRYRGLPGSHAFGGIWSTGDFVSLDPADFVFIPDNGVVASRVGGAYFLTYILEQTLWEDRCHKERNVSLMSQLGIADERTCPIGWSANIGVQATGFSDARPHDKFGMGYFHSGISNDLQNLLSGVLPLQDVDGVEMYYTAALARGLRLTADLQVVEPADARNDTAVVFGLRLSAGM